MEVAQRTALAYLCGCLHSQRKSAFTKVYDNSRGLFCAYIYSNNKGFISVYDVSRNCYIQGRFPSFYDYKISHYITLARINDNMYSVYDYKTSSYLSVTCSSQKITIFDYQVGRYYSYQIC